MRAKGPEEDRKDPHHQLFNSTMMKNENGFGSKSCWFETLAYSLKCNLLMYIVESRKINLIYLIPIKFIFSIVLHNLQILICLFFL